MGSALTLTVQSKLDVLLLIGPPIDKKHDIGRYIHTKFHYSYISMTSLYEKEIINKTEEGKKIEELLKDNKIIPSDISSKLILSYLNDMTKQCVNKFIIDGFPDNYESYEGFKDKIMNIINLQGIINLTVSNDYINKYISTLEPAKQTNIKTKLEYYNNKTLSMINNLEKICPLCKIDITIDPIYPIIDKSFTEIYRLIPGPTPSMIFTIGSSGSGMKTQIKCIKDKFGFVPICPKEVLKAAKIETNYEDVPIEQLLSALETHFIQLALTGSNRFILMNYPRVPEEHAKFSEFFFGKISVIFTFFFHANLETMTKRIEDAKKDITKVKEIDKTKFQTIDRIKIFDTEGKKVEDTTSEINKILLGCPTYPQIPLPKPQILFILGGPGSGKGTQCEYISKKYHLNHISTGDLLRDAQKADTPEGAILRPLLAEGKLVPTTMVIGLVLKKITELKTKCNTFLLDGYPRNFENVTFWNRDAACQVELLGVVNLVCDDEIVAQRIIERGKTSGRSDDNADSVKQRLKTFHDQSQPVIDYYSNHNGFVDIDTNRALPEIQKDVDAVFAKKYPSLKP